MSLVLFQDGPALRNRTGLARKLSAILAKDVDAIVARHVYLPFVGSDYTRAALIAWLKKRSDLLEDVRDNNYTAAQIQRFVLTQYNQLSAADKEIALAIRDGSPFDLGGASSFAAFERLVLIALYKFVTTE